MSTLSTVRKSGGHLVLGRKFHWERVPRHALEVPPNWAAAWDGEFSIDEDDDLAMSRDAALQLVAERNQALLAESSSGGKELEGWWLAFAIGPICTTSFVLVEHAANASFHLDSSLAIVFPTDAEVAAILDEPKPAKRRKGRAA